MYRSHSSPIFRSGIVKCVPIYECMRRCGELRFSKYSYQELQEGKYLKESEHMTHVIFFTAMFKSHFPFWNWKMRTHLCMCTKVREFRFPNYPLSLAFQKGKYLIEADLLPASVQSIGPKWPLNDHLSKTDFPRPQRYSVYKKTFWKKDV